VSRGSRGTLKKNRQLRRGKVQRIRRKKVVGEVRVRETLENQEPRVQKNTVVFLDICSSSKILSQCIQQAKLDSYQDMLVRIKNFLAEQELSGRCEVYKFIGDGWILLLPFTVSGKELMDLLYEICEFADGEMAKLKLERPLKLLGLTLGVEKGELVQLAMKERHEYLGRPLNVAARLQSAVKDGDDDPAYKLFFTESTYKDLRIPKTFQVETKNLKLRNIEDDEIPCVKVTILNRD